MKYETIMKVCVNQDIIKLRFEGLRNGRDDTKGSRDGRNNIGDIRHGRDNVAFLRHGKDNNISHRGRDNIAISPHAHGLDNDVDSV